MAPSLDVDRSRVAWWTIGAALAAVVGFVLWSFVGTFVFGVFIYYATRPVYDRVDRRIRPSSLAAALSLLLLALPALLLFAYTIAIGLQEFSRFADRYDVGSLEGLVEPYLDVSTIPVRPDELFTAGGAETFVAALTSATAYLGVFAIAALHLFVMIAVAFYLLRDGHRLSRWLHHRFDDEAGVLAAYAAAVDRSYHQIFFGNILNAIFTGIIGAVVYNALDWFAPTAIAIPYPTLLGLLAGVASLVPIVGMKLVYFPATLYLAGRAAVSSEPGLIWFAAAFGAVSFVVVDTIPDLVLRPYVSGRNLHVGMVMLAYIFGPLLFGWYGIFLGPMLLVLVVHFARLVLPELVAGERIRPVAVDPTYLAKPTEELPPPDESVD